MRSTQAFSGLFLAALLASPVSVQADDEPAVRADLVLASKDVFRGLARAGESAQGDLEFSQGKLRGGVGANLPFARGPGREVNLNATWTWQPMAGLTIESSARQYWMGEVAMTGVRQSLEAGVNASLAPVGGFTPGLAYYHDFRLQADTVQASLARSVALTGLGAFLDLNLFAGWAAGQDWRPDAPGGPRSDSYNYWGAEAFLPYRIPGTRYTVVTGLHYADTSGRSPTNGPFSLSGGRKLWVTLGVSLDF